MTGRAELLELVIDELNGAIEKHERAAATGFPWAADKHWKHALRLRRAQACVVTVLLEGHGCKVNAG